MRHERPSTSSFRLGGSFSGLIAAAILLLIVTLIPACGSDSATNPAFEPEVANLPDNFQFQSTGVTNVTETLSYSWQNSETSANVDQSGSISDGTATLTIRDADGTEVYTGGLETTGSFTSDVGQSGDWTIDLALQGVSGTLNFRVEKP